MANKNQYKNLGEAKVFNLVFISHKPEAGTFIIFISTCIAIFLLLMIVLATATIFFTAPHLMRFDARAALA